MKPSPVLILKKALREKSRGRLAEMTAAERKIKSVKILKVLLNKKVFQEARTLFTYVALPREVQTADLIKQSLKLGKKVFAPRMKPGSFRFEVCEIRKLQGLKKGAYGVREPQGRKGPRVQKLDLIIVPGLAFDRMGNRLGRGKGYFDRFLEKRKGIPTVGLAFKEQMMRKIPAEKHDCPVDFVITG